MTIQHCSIDKVRLAIKFRTKEDKTWALFTPTTKEYVYNGRI